MKRKLPLLFIVFLTTINTWAYDFMVNDIAYNITSSTVPYTVEVTSGITYTGAITIPTSVSNNSINYSVTSIGYSVFSNCSGLTSVTIPSSITSIGTSAFEDCSNLTLITVEINNQSYASYDGMLFNKNMSNLICCPKGKIGNISIPTTVTSIGYHAFVNCSNLTSVDIPNSVTSIDIGVFANCIGLTSITIPSSVTNFGPWIFLGCTKLKSFHMQSTTPINISPTPNYDIFDYDRFSNCTLYVPIGFKSTYQNAPVWGNFVNIVEEIIDDIQMVSASELFISRQAGKAVLTNLHIGEKLQVYTTDGKLVFSENATKESLSIQLPTNKTYIIKIGMKSAKILM